MTTAFADARRWMAIEASATSTANLNWFATEAFVDDRLDVAAGSIFDRCCHVAESAGLRGSSPIYHPFLYGSPTDPRARAGFYGISASHGRADLARAVLEGVAFGHRRHVSNLVAAGATPGRVRLTGGGARSGFWSQMFADVLGMPIEVPDAEETGARGAALAAGVAIGAYRDIDEAMDRATRVARGYLPNAEHAAVYGRRFDMYTQLVDAMGPFWQELSTTPDGPGRALDRLATEAGHEQPRGPIRPRGRSPARCVAGGCRSPSGGAIARQPGTKNGRATGLGLGHPGGPDEEQRLRPVLHPELPIDVRQVRLGRLRRDPGDGGDGGGRPTRGSDAEHRDLPSCQGPSSPGTSRRRLPRGRSARPHRGARTWQRHGIARLSSCRPCPGGYGPSPPPGGGLHPHVAGRHRGADRMDDAATGQPDDVYASSANEDRPD